MKKRYTLHKVVLVSLFGVLCVALFMVSPALAATKKPTPVVKKTIKATKAVKNTKKTVVSKKKVKVKKKERLTVNPPLIDPNNPPGGR